MNLEEIRLEIDAVDSELVRLYEKRLEVAKKVAEYKIANNKPVLDEAREKIKLDKVRELTTKEENKDGVVEMFELLLKHSRARQHEILKDQD